MAEIVSEQNSTAAIETNGTTLNLMTNPMKSYLAAAALLLSSAPLLAAEDEEPAESGFTNWADSVYLQSGLRTHWSNSDDYRAPLLILGTQMGDKICSDQGEDRT
jgi:hypothetical protein